MILVSNEEKEYGIKISTTLNASNEEDFEQFSDWCDETFGDDDGFYEVDGWDDDFHISLSDDDKGWKTRLLNVVDKVKEYLIENDLN